MRSSNHGMDKGFFSTSKRQTGSTAQPACYSISTGDSSREYKVDNSPASSTEAKNEWSSASTPRMSSRSVRGKFAFTFCVRTFYDLFQHEMPPAKLRQTDDHFSDKKCHEAGSYLRSYQSFSRSRNSLPLMEPQRSLPAVHKPVASEALCNFATYWFVAVSSCQSL
jgi:hypothetical protein